MPATSAAAVVVYCAIKVVQVKEMVMIPRSKSFVLWGGMCSYLHIIHYTMNITVSQIRNLNVDNIHLFITLSSSASVIRGRVARHLFIHTSEINLPCFSYILIITYV